MLLSGGMERAGRSRSLVDLSGGTSGVSNISTTAATHLSLLDLSRRDRFAEDTLLDSGSPPGSPGCSTDCDPALLDIDSDAPETENMDAVDGESVNMAVDNVIP
jgi:hypothetical protein